MKGAGGRPGLAVGTPGAPSQVFPTPSFGSARSPALVPSWGAGSWLSARPGQGSRTAPVVTCGSLSSGLLASLDWTALFSLLWAGASRRLPQLLPCHYPSEPAESPEGVRTLVWRPGMGRIPEPLRSLVTFSPALRVGNPECPIPRQAHGRIPRRVG